MEKFMEILETADLFSGIDPKDLKPLLSCLSGKFVHYEKGQIILMSGETTNSFGIVLSGQVQVIQEDYYGNRSILANLDPGNLFGESLACAEIKALPVSILASADSDILLIDCRRLSSPCANACDFHSKLIRNMMNIIAKKNISLTQKIEFISKRTTREKLLAYLSAEAKRAKSSRFYIPFNRQELADYLSVDRSAMSAELCRLRDEGILKFNKNQFELL
ncbi:MAG: Crp/Fnr family transcriptional regulator [Clostridiales bacterium]|jgi:CRP-like cAMP-binding protein|nr:Crp/Fnr family transcriptional regulator [Clostridiales bacterium]